jgi:tetratricopeptide (TPR) repeat protein
MQVDGAAFAIVGALDAFPRRLAARAIAGRGGKLQRSLSRKTRVAVLGHRMSSWSGAKIIHRIERARKTGASLISENSFLRALGLSTHPETARQISARSLMDQSGLDADTLERLRLFDAFEFCDEPFGFRDLVAARQYQRLLADGLDWLGLVRAVRSGRTGATGGSLANVRLERSSWNDVLVRDGHGLIELSGQHLLALPSDENLSADDLFDEAQEAEEAEDWARARPLYHRAHQIEPSDPVIAFNLSHVLMKLGEWQEARRYLTKVLSLDPNYAEAWYNLASIARDQKDAEAARRYLQKAIAADPIYPDPVYNLALLEFDSGAYGEATRLWERYRELDPDSDWGRRAKQGLQLIGLMASQPGAKIDRKAAEQLYVGR